MNLPSYFKEFLAEIEPSPSYKEDQQAGHKTLRKRLATDEDFKLIHVNTFLQGSYKRNTAIHPGKDVDIVNKKTSSILDLVQLPTLQFCEDLIRAGHDCAKFLLKRIEGEAPVSELQRLDLTSFSEGAR